MTSTNGLTVGDETVDRLAAEAEAGYDLEQLRRAPSRLGPAGEHVVAVRIDPEPEAAQRERAEAGRLRAQA